MNVLFLLLFSMAPELLIEIFAINESMAKVIKSLRYNEKVDIYSFGIVLYELFTERQAYAEEIKKYGANENV